MEINKNAKSLSNLNTKSKILALTAIIYIFMAINGIHATMFGPLIPVFIDYFNISISVSGLIILLQGIGGILALFLGLMFADLVGKQLLIKFLFFVFIVSIFLVALKPLYVILLIILFFFGASIRMIDAVLNAYISDIHPAKLGLYMNLLHASFGIGALLGPLFSSIFINLNLQWNIIFLVYGILCVIILVTYFLIQRTIKIDYKVSGRTKISEGFIMLKNKDMTVLSINSFLYGGLSGAISNWMPTFMQQQMKSNALYSILPVTLLWAGITVGRILFSFLSVKFSIKNLILFSNLLGGLILAVIIVINKPIGYILGFILVGLMVGATMPLSITFGCSLKKFSSTLVSTMIVLSVNMGSMIIPWLFGIVADKAGFLVFIIILSLFPFMTSFATTFLSGHRENLKESEV